MALGTVLAVLALTLPVTIAIALDFVLNQSLHDYILALMALTAEGYFALLAAEPPVMTQNLPLPAIPANDAAIVRARKASSRSLTVLREIAS